MPEFTSEQFRSGLTRTAQIVKFALIMGVLSFGAVAVVLSVTQAGPAQDPPRPSSPLVVSYIAAGMAGVMLIARAVVPNLIAAGQRRQLAAGTWTFPSRSGNSFLPTHANDADRLYPAFMTRMIVGDALLEGAAFFNLVAFMVENQLWNVCIAGLFAAIMAATFPTRISIDNWVEQQVALLEQERQDAPT